MLLKLSASVLKSRQCNELQLGIRLISFAAVRAQQVVPQLHTIEDVSRSDEDWHNAKDFDEMPGPSSFTMFTSFLPGGRYHNMDMVELNKQMRIDYGDVYRIRGMLGKPDVVFTYDPVDFENVYRNEGVWPVRIGLESFTYYRKVKRPDIFKGIGGLVSEQGKAWGDIRNKVNPILMKVQTVRQNLQQIDEIACEFLAKIENSRNPSTNLLKIDFFEELKMWSFESIACIALNKRVGLLGESPDPGARQLAKYMSDFFEQSYEYDVVPSIWQYYETPGFKKFLKTYDKITEITINYIEQAVQQFDENTTTEAKSVLEKLYRVDKKIAVVMAMDMLMAGIDTTTSALTSTLYHLAKNPEKQALLHKELCTMLPDPKAPLSDENTRSQPYLRACIKEALRFAPITPGNFRMASKDLVLSGYKVPKGTGVLMNVMVLSNTDKYFPNADVFMPERWLKSGITACPAAKSKNPFVYLPFGFGARTCIGKRIAEMEIEAFVTRLLREYQITWAGDNDLKYKSTIILTPCGEIKFKFIPLT